LIIKRKQDSDDLSVLLLSKLFNACFAADDVRVCTWKVYSLQHYVKINNHDIQIK